MSESIEAEIVPTQALTVRPQGALTLPTIADLEQSFALAKRQRELIKDYIQSQLKPAKHFYSVRSASKPSLTKEGAEVILLAHGLITDYDIVSGPMEPTEGNKSYQIVIKCVLRPRGNSEGFAGSGIGSASSFISKKDGGRIPRQNDPGLCHNATMKMAQKSAMIAAVLNSTAASEFFTQDIEDFDKSPSDEPEDFKPKPNPSLKPKATPKFDKWLEACRRKLLDLCKPVLVSAWQYAVKEGWILDNERLDAVTATKMFPGLVIGPDEAMSIQSAKDAVAKRHGEIMAGIQAVADGERDEDLMAKFTEIYTEDKPTEPEPDGQPQNEHLGDGSPEQSANPEGETKMGEIVAVSVKHGQSSRGKWTCYGIKIGEDWFNTFDTKLGKELEARKNQYVTIEYETTERGKTVLKLL